jgi:uncharacterized protein (DUF2267 family)
VTVPIDFKTASADFDKFLLDAREATGLTTTNQVWGVLLGLFDAFRRRLTSEQCLAFARALPPLLRAVFVEAWYPAPPIPFADRATLAYHADHQFASNNAIGEIAAVLWRHVDAPLFQKRTRRSSARSGGILGN